MHRTPLRWHHTRSVNSVDPRFRAGREGAASVSTEQNRALVNRFIDEVLNKKNLAVTDEIAVEDFVELDPLPGQGPGREGLKQILSVLFTAFPDQQWTVEEQAAEGEKVWSRFTWRGTHQGEFLGIPPTSRAVTVKGMVIDRFVDGKWTESRILMDNLGMMQQLGVIPEPGQPEEPEPT
jgi:steroid delta-isomerase-like uncharacterized protein